MKKAFPSDKQKDYYYHLSTKMTVCQGGIMDKEDISTLDTMSTAQCTVTKKKPKKIIHFSDGILEEFSSDEEEVDSSQTAVDTQSMTWLPWMWYQTTTAGTKTLQVFDYMGESLAEFFGITTPKYQFEINEYHKAVKAEEEARKTQDLEMGGWVKTSEVPEVIQNQYATDFSPAKAFIPQEAETPQAPDMSHARY